MWRAFVEHGNMPRSGGWTDQPLSLMVTFAVLSMVENTWRLYRQEKFDWNDLSATQLELISWIEEELT